MINDIYKWQELRAWAEDKVRLESDEDSVFFVLLLSKMKQIDSASGRDVPLIRRGTLQDMYPDLPFDGEDW